MGKIFIARSDVYLGAIDTSFEHLFLVYDADGDPSPGSLNDAYVITAGPSGTGIPSFGELISVYDEPILNLDYGSSSDPQSEYTFTEIYSGLDASAVWDEMVLFADQLTDFVSGKGFTTGLSYNPLSLNSNSFAASVLNESGFNVRENFPASFSALDFPGHMGLLDGSGADNFTAYDYDGLFDTTVFFDQAETSGTDTITVEQGGKLIVASEDISDGPVSDINIILEGVTGGITYHAAHGGLTIVKVNGEEVVSIFNGQNLAPGISVNIEYHDGTNTITTDVSALTFSPF